MNINAERRKQRFAENPGKHLWHDDGAAWRTVLDVLAMFRSLQRAYHTMLPDERDGINVHQITFNGFDGNGEEQYLRAARVLIEQEELYPESPAAATGYGLDSHVPMLPGYQRMLRAWAPMRGLELLTREQVLKVTAAATGSTPLAAGDS